MTYGTRHFLPQKPSTLQNTYYFLLHLLDSSDFCSDTTSDLAEKARVVEIQLPAQSETELQSLKCTNVNKCQTPRMNHIVQLLQVPSFLHFTNPVESEFHSNFACGSA